MERDTLIYDKGKLMCVAKIDTTPVGNEVTKLIKVNIND